MEALCTGQNNLLLNCYLTGLDKTVAWKRCSMDRCLLSVVENCSQNDLFLEFIKRRHRHILFMRHELINICK